MFGVSFTELVVIFVVLLLAVGPDKLPQTARTVGEWLGQLRRTSETLRREMYNALYPPYQDPPRSKVQEPPPALRPPEAVGPESLGPASANSKAQESPRETGPQYPEAHRPGAPEATTTAQSASADGLRLGQGLGLGSDQKGIAQDSPAATMSVTESQS